MSVEAMKQALEALVGYELVYGSDEKDREAVRALRQAIEQAEKQEPEAAKRLDGYRELAQRVNTLEAAPRLAQPEQEPVAMRYDFDGYGYKYIDSGSGSDWKTRIKGAEPVYDRPQTRVRLADERIDAARWRFLVDNSFDKEGVTQFHVWEHSWEPHSQTGEPTEWEQRVRGPALDRFIDRAIEKAHDIKE